MYVGLTSDQHVGSAFAMWPAGAKLSSGGTYKPNKGQRYVLRNWQRIAQEIPDLDVLVFAGDGIDGKQPKERGRYIIEPEPLVQARALVAAAQPYWARIRPGGSIYVLRGTGYHDDDDSAMEWFGAEVGAMPDEAGHHAWDWLLLQCEGVLLDIAHTQSWTMRYQSMPLEREGQFSDMAGLQADVIVRAHTHVAHWQYMEGANRLPMRLEVSLPAWQLQTAYAKGSRIPNRMLSRNLGMVVLDVQRDWVGVLPFLFPHPKQRRVKVVTT